MSKIFGMPKSIIYCIINVYIKESQKSKLKSGPRNKTLLGEHIEDSNKWIDEDASITCGL